MTGIKGKINGIKQAENKKWIIESVNRIGKIKRMK